MTEHPTTEFNKNIFESKRREIYWLLKEIGLEEQEAQAESMLIIEQVSGLKPAQQVISDLSEFPIKWLDEITRITNLRRDRRPLAYALGEIEFAGLTYRIIPGVLIPRTDTETLVEAVIEWVENTRIEAKVEAEAAPALKIVEIGIGSGIVAISLLKRLPNCTVWACDTSEAAVALALGNARRHGVHERLTIVHGDWKKVLPNNFDVIVANPPYIPTGLSGAKDTNAKKLNAIKVFGKLLEPEIHFEPKEALFAGEDGLDFYRGFAKILPGHFAKLDKSSAKSSSNCFAAFEFGDGQEEAVKAIFEKCNWQNIKIKNDINNLPRVVTAVPPPQNQRLPVDK